MKWGILLLCGCVAGCGDGSPSGDASGDGGARGDAGDLSANSDGNGSPDLIGVDLTCSPGTFAGFPGITATPRTFDCSCGCTLDSFQNPTFVSGFWKGTQQSASWFVPSAAGLEAVVDSSQVAPAIAGLSSILASNSWFLDGDFDLLVDYELLGGIPPGGVALLQVNNLKNPVDSVYTIERDRTGGVDEYTGSLAGIPPVSVLTGSTSGTLELKRNGVTIQGIADGALITQYTGAVLDRLAVIVTTALGTCALDGGAPVDGSVPGCRLTVRWKNLRLSSGVLIDRQN